MQQLRYLLGWKEGLDMMGHQWRDASASNNAALSLEADKRLMVQNVTRAWELSHREIGAFSFEGHHEYAKLQGLVNESVMAAEAGGGRIVYTLADEGVEERYWWKHGLRYVQQLIAISTHVHVLTSLGSTSAPSSHLLRAKHFAIVQVGTPHHRTCT